MMCVLIFLPSPTVPTQQDYSPLHYASMLGWLDTLQVLLETGANPTQVNVLGQNCLHLACKVIRYVYTLYIRLSYMCLSIAYSYMHVSSPSMGTSR